MCMYKEPTANGQVLTEHWIAKSMRPVALRLRRPVGRVSRDNGTREIVEFIFFAMNMNLVQEAISLKRRGLGERLSQDVSLALFKAPKKSSL